jgi:hypothetical protein
MAVKSHCRKVEVLYEIKKQMCMLWLKSVLVIVLGIYFESLYSVYIRIASTQVICR